MWIASAGVVLASCGSADSDADIQCEANVCPCSEGGIRAAIAEGFGSFTFDCEGPRTVLTGSEIVIERDIILDGGGNLTVDANRRHRVFSVPDDVVVELIGLTIANGNESEEHGGGIRNEGTLTLTNSAVAGSTAGRESGCRTDDAQLLCSEGGGIWNAGMLTLVGSAVSGSSAHFGGGIANRGGTVILNDSAVFANDASGCRGVGTVVCSGGGGIWNSGTLTMQNSTLSESTADWGGGLYNRGAPTLIESTISGNSAGFDGGGLLNFETLTLVDSTIDGNAAGQSGGGIANEAGTLEMTRCTLSGNTAAAAGGAIFNPAGAATDLLNATVSGNAADTGGGIYTGGALSLRSCTMADNDASTANAIFDPGAPDPEARTIASTLIEGDCVGPPFDSSGYNLESPGDTCGFDQQTDRPRAEPINLGPLQDNGGVTQTHALLENSIAIDQIPAVACIDRAGEALETDQRGEARPAGAGPACDIGAFEAQP